jgi:drug/metabolite transporter superfamily protein YnfA
MSIKDVIDLLFAARERVDFYWNFYVVVVIAVVGWLVTRKEPLTPSAKILVTVAFVVAALTNLAGLYASYALAESLRTDLLRMTGGSPLVDTRLILAQHSYLTQRITATLTHVLVGATIVLVIWRNPSPSRGTS